MDRQEIKEAINSMLSGIGVLIDKKIRNADYDRTYIGYIEGTNGTGNEATYAVKVQNMTYENVRSLHDEYVIGDTVYVLFPRNNPNNKVIL